MVRLYILSSAFLCLFNSLTTAQTPSFVWVRPGEVDLGFGRGVKLATDSAGYTYVAGSYTGSTFNIGDSMLTAPNYGEPAMFVAKYNSSGDLLWIKETTNCYLSQPSSIALDAVNGKVNVTGRYCTTSTLGTASYGAFNFTTGFNSMFMAQLDAATGDVLWLKCTNVGAVQNVNTAAGNGIITSGNNVYVVGEYTNTVIFGTDTLTSIGDGDAYLAKYDNNGNLIWIKTAGYPYDQNYFNCVTADVTGNVYVSCIVMQTITLGANNYTGTILTAKYDTNGNLKWVKTSVNGYQPLKILFDSKDHLYVAGTFINTVTFGSTTLTNHSGNYGIFVTKYDTTGNVIWAKSPGGGFESYGALGMAFDQYDNFYLTGNYTGTATFDTSTINAIINGNTSDIFVAKFDTGAHAYWAKTAGGVYTDASNDVGADNYGNSYITGYIGADGSVTNVTFDTITVSVQPNDSYSFLAKIGTVTVAPVAQFSVIDTLVCAGSAVAFTDQSTGSPTSWRWTFAGGTPDSSLAENPTVTYAIPGMYSVKLVVSNSSGTDSLTPSNYITVKSGPGAGAVTGLTAICSGDSIQLSDTSSTGSIQWQSSPDGISFTNITGDTSSTDILSGLVQTTYYRVFASGTCGADSSLPFKLLVNPLPAPVVTAADSIFCSNDSTQVCTSNNFTSYLWNTTDTSSCINVKEAGGYWVTVTDANHCSAVSNHQNINIYPVPSVSIVEQGDTLSSFGQVNYQWILNDSAINNATGPVYVAHEQGSYSVQVTDTNGCTTVSSPVLVTGIDELSLEESVVLFPNPSVASVQLAVSSELVGSALEVYDDNGRVVWSCELGMMNNEISTARWAKGIYWLRIYNDKVSIVRKLAKM